MGAWIVDGNWMLPLVILLVGGYILLTKATGVTPETYILSFLVFGYIVGNRGFAQITPIGNLPVFMGEMGLIIGAGFLVVSISIKRELPFRMDALGIVILIWMVIGSIRLIFDFPSYGILALRDFAMVYYAAFFFIAQPMGRHLKSRKVFLKFFQVAMLLLIPGYLLFNEFPEFFLYSLIFDGSPLIFYKGDLVATFFGIGFIYYYCGYYKAHTIITLAYACAFFFLTIYTTARAAWVGVGVAILLLFLSKNVRIFKHLVSAFLIVSIPASIYYGVSDEDFQQTRAYAVYEHILSIVDFSGTGTYKNEESIGTGANNQFRLIWWQTVISQTINNGPWFGLGFGSDLTGSFYLKYYSVIESNFTTRSPHGFILSVFGRMGVLGLVVIIFVITAMIRQTFQEIKHIRRTGSRTDAFSLWCMCWLIFISACFGVVLEGPMGAVVFWVFLGIANSSLSEEVC